MTDTPLDTREVLALWCENMARQEHEFQALLLRGVSGIEDRSLASSEDRVVNYQAIAALLRSEIPSVGARPSDLDVAREIFRYERPDEPVREGTVAMLRVTVAHVRAAEARLQGTGEEAMSRAIAICPPTPPHEHVWTVATTNNADTGKLVVCGICGKRKP